MASRPHRACLGGAGVSAPEGKRRALSAPTELVSVERGFLHQRGNAERSPPPPSLSRWGGGLRTRKGRTGNRPAGAEACAPPGQARWGRDPVREKSCTKPTSKRH